MICAITSQGAQFFIDLFLNFPFADSKDIILIVVPLLDVPFANGKDVILIVVPFLDIPLSYSKDVVLVIIPLLNVAGHNALFGQQLLQQSSIETYTDFLVRR